MKAKNAFLYHQFSAIMQGFNVVVCLGRIVDRSGARQILNRKRRQE